eukprot:10108266-Alexandrium_andersonii.AAC.1
MPARQLFLASFSVLEARLGRRRGADQFHAEHLTSGRRPETLLGSMGRRARSAWDLGRTHGGQPHQVFGGRMDRQSAGMDAE